MKAFIALLLLFISFSSQGIIIGNQASKMINQSPFSVAPGFINQNFISSPFIKQTPTTTPGFIKQDQMNSFIKQIPTFTSTVPNSIKRDPLYITQTVQPQTIIPLSLPQTYYTQPMITSINPIINTSIPTSTSMLLPINATTAKIIYPPNYIEQCQVSGVYRHLCLSQYDTTNYINTVFHKRYECLKDAVCSFRNGKCQWLQTHKFKRCWNNFKRLGFITFKRSISNFPTTFLGEHY